MQTRRTMAEQQIDHDQNFKELISTFFIEFLDLFLPEIASTIDPESVKFLQQEYFVDLVEVRTRQYRTGQERLHTSRRLLGNPCGLPCYADLSPLHPTPLLPPRWLQQQQREEVEERGRGRGVKMEEGHVI